MANETILVVDADQKIQKVLEVSLKKSGYRVVLANAPTVAADALDSEEPDLIISETEFEEGDGFAFLEKVRGGSHASIPFLFLTENRDLPQKMKGYELGADDYLTKPFYLKEITSRAELLIQKRQQDSVAEESATVEFTGDLSDITMIDLLQSIESENQSGSLHIHTDTNDAVVYFQDGNILDAFCGKLQGEEAIYRLFLWSEGDFVVRYANLAGRPDRIDKDSSALLIEGINRLQQYQELSESLPSLNSVFDADFDKLTKLGQNLPPEVSKTFRLFDGTRTLRGVIDHSGTDDITTLKIIGKLHEEGLIFEVEGAPGLQEASNLETWLSGPSAVLADDPSELVTPSRRTEKLDVQARDVREQRQSTDSWDTTSLKEASDAIREIEDAEEKRREAEATRLSGEFEAVSRDDSKRKTELIAPETVTRAAEQEPAGVDDTGELFVGNIRKRERRQTPVKSQASVAAIEGKVETFDAEIDEDEASTAEIPNAAHALAPLVAADADIAAPTLNAVSEADVFEDSDPVDDSQSIDPRETLKTLQEFNNYEPDPTSGTEKSTERTTNEIGRSEPEFDANPAMPAEVGGIASDMFVDEFGAGDTPSDGTLANLPKVERTSTDGEMVRTEYTLRNAETPASATAAATATTAAASAVAAAAGAALVAAVAADDDDDDDAEAQFFANAPPQYNAADGPDTFDDLFDEPERNNTGIFIVGALLLLGIFGFLSIVMSGDSDDADKTDEVVKAKPQTPTEKPPTEEPKEDKEAIAAKQATENSQTAGTEQGTATSKNAVNVTLVMSGEDLLVDDSATDPGATNNDIALANVENSPTESPGEEPKADVQPEQKPVETPPENPKQAVANTTEKPPKTDTEKTDPAPADNGFKAQLSKADRLVKRGKWRDALKLLRELSNDNPKSSKVAYLHGRAAFESNANSEAITYFNRADKLGYRSASMMIDLAAAYQLDGQKGKAKTAYERFLKLKPTGKQADEVRSILANQF